MNFIIQIIPTPLLFIGILSLFSSQTLHAAETQPFNPLESAEEFCTEFNRDNQPTITHSSISENQAWHLTAAENQTPEDYKHSLAYLCSALQTAPPKDSYHQAILLGNLGHAYFMIEEIEKAAILLEQSQELAQSFPDIAAVTLNNLGNVCATYYYQDEKIQEDMRRHNPHFKRICVSHSHQTGESNQALTYYLDSARLADQVGNPILALKAKLNWVQIALKMPSIDYHTIKKQLFNLAESIHQGQLVKSQLSMFLQLGKLFLLAYHRFPAHKTWLQYRVYEVLMSAFNLATQLNHQPSRSQAAGLIGQLYQDEQRYQEALQWTQQAIFYAQSDKNNYVPELLYRWQWQAGDLFKAENRPVKALLAYKQAIDTLWSIRYDFSKIHRIFQSSFRHQVGDLFLDFIELLLKYRPTLSNKNRQEICHISNQSVEEPPNVDKLDRCLQKVQDILEKLKAAELVDYFRSDCVIDNQKKLTQTVEIGKETAVLYPIMLKNKLELLLYKEHRQGEILQREIIRETVKVTAIKIREEIEQFRNQLLSNDKQNPYAFKIHASNLYHWLIHPLQEQQHLDNIETLVLVPDEKLRLLPIAALYDGEKYLVEQYAIAVVPGLTLVLNDNSVTSNHFKIQPLLFAGILSDQLQTQDEIDRMKNTLCPNNSNNCFDELLDDQFTEGQLRKQLEQSAYSVIHISSHASFAGNVKKTYIETYQKNPLYLEAFGELLLLNLTHDVPLNLVTLSACETAVSDDERGALGLGGMALRTGAQSVVATLWKVDSFFTKEFIPIFYRQLKIGKTTAQALQEAQKSMIKTPLFENYDHPSYWSAFLLIGNGF